MWWNPLPSTFIIVDFWTSFFARGEEIGFKFLRSLPKIGFMEKLALDGQPLRLEEIDQVALAGRGVAVKPECAKTGWREPRPD